MRYWLEISAWCNIRLLKEHDLRSISYTTVKQRT